MNLHQSEKFVNEWLCHHRKFGTEVRLTTGLTWSENYKLDAAQMIRDSTQNPPDINSPQFPLCHKCLAAKLCYPDVKRDSYMCYEVWRQFRRNDNRYHS